MAYGDTSFSQQIFNVSVAQAESVVEPDRVADDIQTELVALVCSHRTILAKCDFNSALPSGVARDSFSYS